MVSIFAMKVRVRILLNSTIGVEKKENKQTEAGVGNSLKIVKLSFNL